MDFIFIGTLVLAALAFVVWITNLIGTWAWNAALVPLFHLPIVTHWQFLGIQFLLSMIAGIFRVTVNHTKE